ncbi:MAG: peptidase dimerization domain-containing protein, partial [Promethearchaeota archaeon]
ETSVLKLGYKGILSLTIRVSTTNKEAHSAFSSMMPNPSQDLIFVLNGLYSENKFKINSLSVPYKMTKNENNIIEDLMESIDLGIVKEKAGIRQTLIDDPKLSFINYLFSPSFNISTLKSGYLENGIKNIVANKAECNIDIRFAHDVSVNLIFEEIKKKVKDLTRSLKSSFEIIQNTGYERSIVREDSILVKGLVDSSKELGFATQIWRISAAAAPLSQIQSQLGLNFVVGGLGIGGYAHAPNEFVQVNSIQNTRLSNYLFLKNYSDLCSLE